MAGSADGGRAAPEPDHNPQQPQVAYTDDTSLRGAPMQQRTNAGTTYADYPVTRKTEDRAVAGPDFQVPDGAYVELSPLANASDNCFYSTVSPEAAKNGGPRTKMLKTSLPRKVKARFLSDIFVYSDTIGDGLNFSVQKDS